MCSCPLFLQTSQSASNTPSDEVILRIIMVSSAEQAQHVLALLKQGEDFAVLAKKQKGVNFYSLEREQRLGRELAAELEQQVRLLDDGAPYGG